MNPFFTAEIVALHHRELINDGPKRRHRPGRHTTLRHNPAEPPTSA